MESKELEVQTDEDGRYDGGSLRDFAKWMLFFFNNGEQIYYKKSEIKTKVPKYNKTKIFRIFDFRKVCILLMENLMTFYFNILFIFFFLKNQYISRYSIIYDTQNVVISIHKHFFCVHQNIYGQL